MAEGEGCSILDARCLMLVVDGRKLREVKNNRLVSRSARRDYFDGVGGVEALASCKRADDGYLKLAWFSDGITKSLPVEGNFESDMAFV